MEIRYSASLRWLARFALLLRRPGVCAVSGPAWKSERRLRDLICIVVLSLVAWVAEAPTWLVRGLGIGVDAGAAASGLRHCVACVAFVVVLSGVGSGRLGGRVDGLVGARSWDRCW